MHNISITVEDDVFRTIEATARTLNLTVASFIQNTLRMTVQRQQTRDLEEQHRQGYLKYPATGDEFSAWEDEQVWGDD